MHDILSGLRQLRARQETISFMDTAIRRVAGTIVGPPLTSRNRRELMYCGFGGLAGVAGFWITLVLLLSGLTISVSIIGTVVGLVLITMTLRVSRRIGSLHRRLLRRVLGRSVEAPPPFQPGTGILNRVDRRLRDRPAWRSVWYALIKLPVSAVQLYAVALTAFGLADVAYPAIWLLFRNHHGGSLSPMVAVVPVPFGGNIRVGSWLGAFPAALAGAVCVVAAAWLARGINAADARLVRGLLGPSSMAERVSELERTRALAVDDSAAALRRVERDLHDGAQMRLAALAMNLGMAREKLGDDDQTADSATVRELIDAAHRNAVDALADLRDLARGIHPPVLDNGLASALATLSASSAIPATVSADIGTRPAPAIETIAYFCAAELMANATKHSYANQIKIDIHTERTGVLVLEVSDDGVGGADAGRGSGLSGLAQRVSTVDGRINVSSPAGGPTMVTVELPLRA
jgi:signal transduction histidine kinase